MVEAKEGEVSPLGRRKKAALGVALKDVTVLKDELVDLMEAGCYGRSHSQKAQGSRSNSASLELTRRELASKANREAGNRLWMNPVPLPQTWDLILSAVEDIKELKTRMT